MDSLENILEHLDRYFEDHPQCSEHALLSHLREHRVEPFDQFNIHHSKELFCAHFLTMHALYQLQNRYHQSQSYCLLIEGIRIQRASYSSGTNNISSHDPLKSYYLDISHVMSHYQSLPSLARL